MKHIILPDRDIKLIWREFCNTNCKRAELCARLQDHIPGLTVSQLNKVIYNIRSYMEWMKYRHLQNSLTADDEAIRHLNINQTLCPEAQLKKKYHIGTFPNYELTEK